MKEIFQIIGLAIVIGYGFGSGFWFAKWIISRFD